jgi:negative regulator of replication initiation
MKLKTIRIDEEVWRALQKRGTAFEDTPNDVLRRVLRLDGKRVRSVERRTRVKPGVKTAQDAFRKPILRALYDMGGSGQTAEVLDRVERIMRHELNEIDRQTTASGAIRWRNAAQWARKSLVQEAFLKKNSPHGVWELTSKGLAEAEDSAR